MAQDHGFQLLHGRSREKLASFEIVGDLLKDPRISLRPPGHHDPVTARLLHKTLRILRCKDISVSDYRDLHSFFNLADDIPVSFSRVILLSRSTMDSHRRHTGTLGDLCDLHSVDTGIVKALAEFHSHRLFHRFHEFREDFLHQLRISHEGRAFTILNDLRHRAAHVDIKNIVWTILQARRDIRYDIRIRAKKLQGHGTLPLIHL